MSGVEARRMGIRLLASSLCLSTRTLRTQGPSAARVARMSASSSAPGAGSAGGLKYFLLIYDYVPDILEKRTPYREEHLKLAKDASEQGHLLYGGALMDPVDKGHFVWQVAEKQVITEFIKKDPYVINGLVPSFSIREWNVVVGKNL